MHIPRQADRSDAARPAHVAATAAGTVVEATVDAVTVAGLRARRSHLVSQLRAVAYWQRLVRARTDLVVAGLLYSAPSPASGAPAWSPAGPAPRPVEAAPEVEGLTAPPEGLDVGHLLDAAGACDHARSGTGGHLDRLRATATVLTRHSRALQEELDEVTAALHEGLAGDGADEASPAGVVSAAPGLSSGLPAGPAG